MKAHNLTYLLIILWNMTLYLLSDLYYMRITLLCLNLFIMLFYNYYESKREMLIDSFFDRLKEALKDVKK